MDTTTEAENAAPDVEHVEHPEVVERGPSTEIEQASPRSAVEAAAEAALAMPGMPGRDEFLTLAMQARVLSMSGAAPAAVRQSPHVALHVAMVGRDLGISPSAALELIDIIDGGTDQRTGEKQYRLSLSPQLINGQIRRLGLGSIIPIRRTAYECVAVALGPRGVYDPRCRPLWPEHHPECGCFDVLGDSTFTWEDAQLAGLAGRDCQPGDHKTREVQRGQRKVQRCGCNSGYITYPQRMMWWRAAGFCADDYFPEAGLGLYTPEALGAHVGPDGRPIDPTDVELPPGYEPAAEPPPAEPPAPPAPADPDALWALQVRIMALPDEQRALMAERWKDSGRLTWEDDHGQRHPIRASQLPASALTSAESMVTGFERLAARADETWNPETAAEEVLARLAPTVAAVAVPLVIIQPPATAATAHQDGPRDAPGGEGTREPAEGHTAPVAEDDVEGAVCAGDDCTSPAEASGYCSAHEPF